MHRQHPLLVQGVHQASPQPHLDVEKSNEVRRLGHHRSRGQRHRRHCRPRRWLRAPAPRAQEAVVPLPVLIRLRDGAVQPAHGQLGDACRGRWYSRGSRVGNSTAVGRGWQQLYGMGEGTERERGGERDRQAQAATCCLALHLTQRCCASNGTSPGVASRTGRHQRACEGTCGC